MAEWERGGSGLRHLEAPWSVVLSRVRVIVVYTIIRTTSRRSTAIYGCRLPLPCPAPHSDLRCPHSGQTDLDGRRFDCRFSRCLHAFEAFDSVVGGNHRPHNKCSLTQSQSELIGRGREGDGERSHVMRRQFSTCIGSTF